MKVFVYAYLGFLVSSVRLPYKLHYVFTAEV